MNLERDIIRALRQVYDPEIPVNVYDLGLIYEIRVNEEHEVYIQMTLTAPNCPMADYVVEQVYEAVKDVPGVVEVKVDLEGFFAYWKSKKYLLDVLEINGLSPLMINQLYGRLEAKPLKQRISGKELKYTGYISAIMTMLISWHHAGMQQSEKEMSLLVKEMFSLS